MCHRELMTLHGDSAVGYSPDGKRIVTGGYDTTAKKGVYRYTAKVWDAAIGRKVLSLNGHTGTVNCVAYSPDGKRIVTGSGDTTAKVWDAISGRELLTFKGHTNQVLSVAFSPDGRRVVTGSWGPYCQSLGCCDGAAYSHGPRKYVWFNNRLLLSRWEPHRHRGGRPPGKSLGRGNRSRTAHNQFRFRYQFDLHLFLSGRHTHSNRKFWRK